MSIGFPLNITLPTSGQVQWDSTLNTALQTLVDAVEAKVTADGINIASALDMQGNYLLNINGLKFKTAGDDGTAQSIFWETVAGKPELFVRDGAGNAIQVTSGGALNIAGTGGFGGDYVGSSAQAVYTSSGAVFTFTSSPGVYATMESGDLKVHAGSAASYTDVKSSPVLGSTYSVTLPSAAPAAVALVTMDTTGSLATTRDPSVNSISTTQLTASYLLPSRSALPAAGTGLRAVTVDPTGSIGLMPASASFIQPVDVAAGVASAGSPTYGETGWALSNAGDAIDIPLPFVAGDTIYGIGFATNTVQCTASLRYRGPGGTHAILARACFNSPTSTDFVTLSGSTPTVTGTFPITPAGTGSLFARYEVGGGGVIGGLYLVRISGSRPRN